ncbi:hypothetical protein HGO97_000795 [Faecalicatena sp. AGMB00832]|uniref:Uncharacterized protein n=1 Tax=Faecalicatena faecalis TaxID=2726362 RepID=A0ABS6CYX6_9FIRM|nr:MULTISPECIES: hypothetical protein [Faecalicatena]MBU3874356.1 hypothetical protein [Faecalicatena faecalis]MCI6464514.1 hypothetical protein [Faecalicatena sp.]MDY5619076.1 hypothetical protein [Lachnospiraceae bacterium]
MAYLKNSVKNKQERNAAPVKNVAAFTLKINELQKNTKKLILGVYKLKSI